MTSALVQRSFFVPGGERRGIYVNIFGYIFLVGLALGGICRKLGLPRIVGMLFTGVVLGPYGKFLSREKP